MKETQTPHRNNFISRTFCLGLISFFTFSVFAQKTPPARSITVITEPSAIIWLDDVRHGETDPAGKLTLRTVSPGAHKLRVRADGFKEITQNLLPAQKGEIKITLVKTTDQAELAFQQAEAESDKEKAVELYKKAIRLRPQYAEANLGLARALSDSGDYDGALKAVATAKRARPGYAEASAVEGRIYKSLGNEEKSVAAFKRAITEGKGFQPEAHTGLAILYQEKADFAGGKGDFDDETTFYLEAAKHFQSAIKQLSGAPDAITIYQLLGLVYEKLKKYNEAIAVYEEFLRVFPDSTEKTAVESFIVQLKKQMQQ